MPRTLVNGIGINYELDGQGEEVIVILNGIMMNTFSWADCIGFYTKNGYRTLRVDFRDQGLSDRSPVDYQIGQHVEDLKGLLDDLGLTRVILMGTSYGGQVALLFALQYQERVSYLVLANTAARITPHLKAIGEAWEEAAKLNDGEVFLKLASPLIYSDTFYVMNYAWLQQRAKMFGELLTEDWFQGFCRLSSSHGNYDIREQIREIKIPTLIIGAERDVVTPLSEVRTIHQAIQDSVFVIIPEAGHASFYEKSTEFNAIILGFLTIRRVLDKTIDNLI